MIINAFLIKKNVFHLYVKPFLMCYQGTFVDKEWLKNVANEIIDGRITLKDSAKQVHLKNTNGQTIIQSFTTKTLSNHFKANGIEVFKVGRKGFSKTNSIIEKQVIDNYSSLNCGVTKMWCFLQNEGVSCSRKDVEKVYDAKIREKKVKEEKKQIPRCRYECVHVNVIWHGDIHYINLLGEVKFLFALMDDKSRFIVGYGLSETKTSSFIISVFRNAVDIHDVSPLFYWSDNGRENTSKEMMSYLSSIGAKPIRTKPYNPQQNGKIERWWQELEKRIADSKTWDEISSKIDDFVEVYNFKLPHSALLCNGRMCTPSRLYCDENLQSQELEKELIKIDGKNVLLKNFVKNI